MGAISFDLLQNTMKYINVILEEEALEEAV